MIEAIQEGKYEVVDAFLKLDENIKKITSSYFARENDILRVFKVAENGNIKVLKAFIERYAIDTGKEYTAAASELLEFAAKQGSAEVAKALIQAGAEINGRVETAVIKAAQKYNNMQPIETLIKAGANFKFR